MWVKHSREEGAGPRRKKSTWEEITERVIPQAQARGVCPTWKRGFAWDLREMGSACGKGVKGGLAPQKAGKISSQRSARKEPTWRRKKKEGGVGRDEEGEANRVSIFLDGSINNKGIIECDRA
jgi:hypothetical protein